MTRMYREMGASVNSGRTGYDGGMTDTENMQRITRFEVAALAGVSLRTVKRWAVAGKLTETRDPLTGRVFYDRGELISKLNA